MSLAEIAKALRDLGTADAATPMGALEFVAMELRNGAAEVAHALSCVAEEIGKSYDGFSDEERLWASGYDAAIAAGCTTPWDVADEKARRFREAFRREMAR